MPENSYHPDCADCCAIGRCHYCFQPGQVTIRREWDHCLFVVCAAHAAFLRENQYAPQGVTFAR